MIADKTLKGHELFKALTVDEINKLSNFSALKEFKNGATIFEYNQKCSHIYMLVQGDVYLQLPANPSEFSFAISRVEKGELLGLSPLLNADRYTATAKCYKPTKVLAIEAAPFKELMLRNPSAGSDFINRVARIYYGRYLGVLKKLQNVVSQVSLDRSGL